jgi:hypothetical protein
MPREIQVVSIRSQLPKRYCQHQLMRFVMIGFSGLITAYSLYFLIRFVNSDTPIFFKILPLFIMFIALDSVFRHTTSLNCITFLEDRIRLTFLLKKPLEVTYDNILKLDMQRRITYYLNITYRDKGGREQVFRTPASFPKILQIIYGLAELATQAEMGSFLSKAVELLKKQAEANNDQQV